MCTYLMHLAAAAAACCTCSNAYHPHTSAVIPAASRVRMSAHSAWVAALWQVHLYGCIHHRGSQVGYIWKVQVTMTSLLPGSPPELVRGAR
jgi:hypothetical protein